MTTGGSWPPEGEAPSPAAPPAPMQGWPTGPVLGAPPQPKRRRKAVWVAAVAAVVAAAVSATMLVGPGLGGGPSPVGPRSGAAAAAAAAGKVPVEEVAAMLARRGAAIKAHDKAGFLADIDLTDPEFVGRQTRLYDNLRKLPLARASWKQAGDHVFTGAATGGYGVPTYVPAITFVYQLKGFDKHPIDVPMAFTFAKRDGRWLLAGDDDVTTLPDERLPEPWDVSTIVVKRGPHVLVVGSAKDAKRLSRVVTETEIALTKDNRMWSRTKQRSVVVYVPREKSMLAAYFAPLSKNAPDPDGVEFPLVATVPGWYGEPDSRAVAGTRVVLNTRTTPPTSRYLAPLLRHEVAHVVTGPWTHHGAPDWLVEGIAEYTAYREDPYARGFHHEVFVAAAAGHLLAKLPTNKAFYGLKTGYDTAYLLCYYIKRTYGEAKLIALYKQAGAIDKDSQTASKTKAAIQHVLGVSQAQLLKNLNAWGRNVVRPA